MCDISGDHFWTLWKLKFYLVIKTLLSSFSGFLVTAEKKVFLGKCKKRTESFSFKEQARDKVGRIIKGLWKYITSSNVLY